MTRFTPAVAEDAAELSAFANGVFTQTFGHIYDPADLALFLSTWNPPDKLRAQIADPAWAFNLVRDDAGSIIGYAKMGPLEFDLPPEQPTDNAVELHQIYLSDAAKGTGIATVLMDWGIAWARERADTLYLSVFIDNHRAQAVYRRYGFTDVGRNAFRVGNHTDEDRFFRLDL